MNLAMFFTVVALLISAILLDRWLGTTFSPKRWLIVEMIVTVFNVWLKPTLKLTEAPTFWACLVLLGLMFCDAWKAARRPA